MKRITQAVVIVLVMSALSIALVACGKSMSDSAYLGKWTATEASYGGITLGIADTFGELSFDLKDNGKCEANIDGETETGSWVETENGFVVEDEFTVVVDGDTGTMDYEGVTIVFEHA